MSLNDYNLEYGIYPVDFQQGNVFSMVSSPVGITTYDQKLSIYRTLFETEIPQNENGLIKIEKATSTTNQVKIQLSTSVNKDFYPFVKNTIIIKGIISSLDTNGLVIATDQIVGDGYSWKLILFPDKIQLRKFDVTKINGKNYNPNDFNYTYDKYISIEIENDFVINDEFAISLRFTENNSINTNPDNLMEMDLSVNSVYIDKISSSFNINIKSNGIINFYDVDDQFESEFLLDSCIKIFDLVEDTDVIDLLNDTTQISNKTNENTIERQQANSIKRKTITIPSLATGDYELFNNTEIQDNKKLYIHDLQIRAVDKVGGEAFGSFLTIMSNDGISLLQFQGVMNPTSKIPDGGFWNLNTSNMGLTSLGPYGFIETGVTSGTGIKLNINLANDYEFKVTIYYTIE